MSDRAAIIECIRKIKRKVLPDHTLILFGSQARNEANQESDWDLLILLDKPRKESTDFDTYADPFVELGWEIGELINPLIYIYTFPVGDKKPSLFRKNVQTEGIEIV
ncbi:MAG: nucleotidyltransferase domain-containing protein [Bacteroides sp.]|nr:nucleotidyltransferase domain-containing protein [Bacteroides sp.]